MKHINVGFAFFLILFSIASLGACYPMTASSNKIVYVQDETVNISGTIGTSLTTGINYSTWIFNASGLETSGILNASNGTFSFAFNASSNYAGHNCFVLISSGSDIVRVDFKAVSYLTLLEAQLISNSTVYNINTTMLNNPSDMSGNFTDIFTLNKSAVYYGNQTYGQTDYHFTVIDQNSNGTFDTIYLDDDKIFMLYNYTEDSTGFLEQQALKKGSYFRLNGTSFGISCINTNGSSVIIGIPRNASVYSAGETVTFIVTAKDSNGILLNGTHVNISLSNATNTTFFTNGTTNAYGYLVANITAPSVPGTYKILLNGEPSEVFSVESFSLKGMLLDESGSPAYSFTENPVITIRAISKTLSGAAFNLSSATATVIYPNGDSHEYPLYRDSEGVRSAVADMSGAPSGEYRVRITGVNGSVQQQFDTGFAIETVGLETIAFNTAYIDMLDKGGPGFAVSAFAPQRNATIMVLLTNISAGGIYTDGPPAVVDIDDPATAEDECNTRIKLIELRDENGFSYLSNVTFNASNFTNTFSAFNMPGSVTSFIPDNIKRQCVLRIEGLNKTGVYRAKIKIIHPMGTRISGATFGIQKVMASGDTVDMKGEDYAFFAPNETVRMKLKVTELYNNSLVDSSKIINAKIISMQKEFPSYEDALSPSYLLLMNESISNGTLVFRAPPTEGFYTMKFRFITNATGQNETGIGTASFMLKKYIIWTEAGDQGKWFIEPGKNITLSVSIIDVAQGARKDMGMASGMSCTGCEGLVANVTRISNDQRMADVPFSGYTIIPGNVMNSTSGASITIIPNGTFDTGWYGVDIQLFSLDDPGETYFGWGGFEIRNFFVDMMPLEISPFTGNLSFSDQAGGMGSNSFALNGSVLFGIIPRIPGQWDGMINSDDTAVEIESIKWMQNGPPAEVPLGMLSVNKSVMNVAKNSFNPNEYMTMWVLNISGFNSSSLNKTGSYQANIRVTVNDEQTDIGSFYFDLSTFRITSAYRGQQEWPATFSTDELLDINFTAFEFGSYAYHNISNYTLDGVYDNKKGISLRNNQLNYSFIDMGGTIMFRLNLSNFTDGMYRMSFKITDNQSNVKRSEVEFQVKNMIVAIPSIEQIGLWRTDTATKDIDLDNEKDWCYNEKWLRGDDCPDNPESICLDMGVHVINVPSKTNNSINRGGVFCIAPSGEWRQGECQEQGNNVYVASNSNSSRIWVASVSNVSNSSDIAANNTFYAELRNVSTEWNVTSIGGNGNENRIIIRLAGNKVCGSSWLCDGQDCQENQYTLTLPAYYSSAYHGYRSLVDTGGMEEFGEAFSHNRTVYIFHNTSHIWISNSTDLSGITPVALGGMANDTKGGRWNVTLLNKRSIRLTGMNVLASTGAFINTTLSRTGVFRIGLLREDQLGAWNKDGGQRAGINLNNNFDGSNNPIKNDTFYIAVSDNSVPGIYDLLYFSNSSDFTTNGSTWKIMPVNGNRLNRTFGSPDTLTMINIPPRADSIILYSKSPGDWSDLGEYRRGGSNITIPIIARTPSGTGSPANISVSFARNERTRALCMPAQTSNATVSGIGEISVNISNCPAGEYTFAINITRNGISELLDEWKWPRATTRDFLSDISIGMGGWISGFKPMTTWRYDGSNYGDIPELVYVEMNGGEFNTSGAFIFMNQSIDVAQCPGGSITYPAGITGQNLSFLGNFSGYSNSLSDVYFIAFNRSIWMKSGDCNFGASQRYNESDQINITRNGKEYMLYVLYANSTPGDGEGIVIGAAGVNESFEPLRSDCMGDYDVSRLRIMAASIAGAKYDVILSNDTTYDYPMCGIWNTECTKKAWFSTTGNFSMAPGAAIGQNFTKDLYVAKIGPGPWDGIVIANFSNVSGQLPMFDARTSDNPQVWFGIFNETSLGMDLDKDGSYSSAYYAIAFDDKENGQAGMTSLKIDDDIQITDDFWGNCTNPQECSDYKDFNTSETGMREMWQSLPDSIYKGSIFFGDRNQYQGVSYDDMPEWEIAAYNNTDMLIQKKKWWNNVTENITMVVKVYNFDQSPVPGANISVVKITKFTPMGPSTMGAAEYNVTAPNNGNMTNSYGYGMLRITHSSPWSEGEYMVALNIQYGSNNQTSYQWFRISSQPMDSQ